MAERTCIDCGQQWTLVSYKSVKCPECRLIGTCTQCGGPTRKQGTQGKVPTICSVACGRERARKWAREKYSCDEAHRNYVKKKACPEVVCVECSVPIEYVAGQRRRIRCAGCAPIWEKTRLAEKERRRSWRRQGINITLAEYELMQAEQMHLCAICARPSPNLYVDHCHSTGAVRGLLCNNCNIGLGMLADDPSRLRLAADYLERKSA